MKMSGKKSTSVILKVDAVASERSVYERVVGKAKRLPQTEENFAKRLPNVATISAILSRTASGEGRIGKQRRGVAAQQTGVADWDDD